MAGWILRGELYSQAEAGRWQDEGGLPRSALFHNEEGTFTDASAGSGADVAIRGNGCVAADFDMDGRTDLYVTGSEASVLLWNEGEGRFSDGRSTDAGGGVRLAAGAAVGDVNATVGPTCSWPATWIWRIPLHRRPWASRTPTSASATCST